MTPLSATELPAVGPASIPIVPEDPERSVLDPLADDDDDPLVGGRFDKCLGFEVLPFPFNDSGTFLPNENECIPFVSASAFKSTVWLHRIEHRKWKYSPPVVRSAVLSKTN